MFSQKIDDDYNNLRQLILIEEFKGCIHSDVRTYIDEQKVETLDEAARLADDYSLTHRILFADKPYQSFSCSRQNGLRSSGPSRNLGKQDPKKQNFHDEIQSSPKFIPPAQKSKPEVANKRFSSVVCNYCKKGGHLSDCFKLKRKQEAQNEAKPTDFITSKETIPQSCDSLGDTLHEVKSFSDSDDMNRNFNLLSEPIMETFESFIHDGFVSLTSDLSSASPIRILRDTGALQSLLLADRLPFSEQSSAGAIVLIKGVDSSDYTSAPLYL